MLNNGQLVVSSDNGESKSWQKILHKISRSLVYS